MGNIKTASINQDIFLPSNCRFKSTPKKPHKKPQKIENINL